MIRNTCRLCSRDKSINGTILDAPSVGVARRGNGGEGKSDAKVWISMGRVCSLGVIPAPGITPLSVADRGNQFVDAAFLSRSNVKTTGVFGDAGTILARF